MSTKLRVSFDVDIGRLAPDAFEGRSNTLEIGEALIHQMLFTSARHNFINEVRAAQRSALPKEERTELVRVAMRKAMLTLEAQANLMVSVLPEDAVIKTDYPIEIAA